MKHCTYCGRENEDHALHCGECGTEFVALVIPEFQMPQSKKNKRPASHRWAIGILAFMTVHFVVFLNDVITGRSGASPKQHVLVFAFFGVGALALFSLVLGRRKRWAYYVTSGSLAIWAGQAIYAASLLAYHILVNGGPLIAPYFYLSQRDKPFVVEEHFTMSRQVLVIVAVGLLVWLFIRFTFGHPSRSYYKFCDPGKE